METIWLSPTEYVSGDPSLKVSHPFLNHPNTIVTLVNKKDVGLHWISMSLPLPPNVDVQEVIVCYQVSNAQSFISHIRLVEMTTPDKALVRYEDSTGLKNNTPVCYSGRVGGFVPVAAVTLDLGLEFQSTNDRIMLGAVGVKIQPTEGRVNILAFGAKGDGSDATAALAAALNAVAGNEQRPGRVFFPPGTYQLNSINVGGNVLLELPPGALLNIPAGQQVKLFSQAGVVAYGPYQIVTGNGDLLFLNDSSPHPVYPEWWGAIKTSIDCSAIMNKMLASGAREFILTGLYYIGSPVTATGSITIRGLSRQSTGLTWTGGPGTALTLNGQDVLLHNFSVNNLGAGSVGIHLRNAERFTLDAVTIGNTGSHIGFSTAAINLSPQPDGEPDTVTLRNVAVFSQQAGRENGIGFWSNAGVNTLNIEDCIFSGNLIGVRLGGAGGESEEPVRVAGTHFEAFTDVGGASAIGLQIDIAYAPSIDCCGFQMSGPQQTAIKLIGAQGGQICSCTFNGERDVLDGHGPTDHMIDIADAQTRGVTIENNWGFGISGPLIRVTGTGSITNVNVGDNYLNPGNTFGVYSRAVLQAETIYRQNSGTVVTHRTPQQFGAVGDGNHDDTAALIAACADASTYGQELQPGVVYLPFGTYKITSHVVVDGHTVLMFAPGARLVISDGKKIQFFQPQAVIASIQQIFDGPGTVEFKNDAAPMAVYPEWWGAVKGSGDSAPAIRSAILSGGSRVLLTGYYFISTPIVIPGNLNWSVDIEGTVANAGVRWMGGASIAMDFQNMNHMRMAHMVVDNTGSATVGVQVGGAHVLLDDVRFGSGGYHVGFSGAAFQTAPIGKGTSIYDLTLRDVQVNTAASGSENAIGILFQGNMNNVRVLGGHFSGNKIGVQVGNDLGTSSGVEIIGAHFESFSGESIGYPGGTNAVGLLLQNAYSPFVAGCSFQMDGDSGITGATQKAIKLVKVAGGMIVGNMLEGAGQCTSVLDVADAAAKGTLIESNQFWDINGYGISVSGTGDIKNVNAGPGNVAPAPTLGIFNGTTHFSLPGALGVGNAQKASGPVGNVVKKVQVFDSVGNPLGYVPIYDAIT